MFHRLISFIFFGLAVSLSAAASTVALTTVALTSDALAQPGSTFEEGDALDWSERDNSPESWAGSSYEEDSPAREPLPPRALRGIDLGPEVVVVPQPEPIYSDPDSRAQLDLDIDNAPIIVNPGPPRKAAPEEEGNESSYDDAGEPTSINNEEQTGEDDDIEVIYSAE
ncbi:MAG: hypothetical protein J5J00_06560 [Deltaproteobacteria bacterium]|nr:hypothetical protein [Deltaproteobacteria bacterium]